MGNSFKELSAKVSSFNEAGMKLNVIFCLAGVALGNTLTGLTFIRHGVGKRLMQQRRRPTGSLSAEAHKLTVDELIRAMEKIAQEREQFNRMMRIANGYAKN